MSPKSYRDELRSAIRTFDIQGDPPLAAECSLFAWLNIGGRIDAKPYEFVEIDGVPFYRGSPAYGRIMWLSSGTTDRRQLAEDRREWMRDADAQRAAANLAAAKARAAERAAR